MFMVKMMGGDESAASAVRLTSLTDEDQTISDTVSSWVRLLATGSNYTIPREHQWEYRKGVKHT